MWLQRQASATTPEASSSRAVASSVAPSFAAVANNARLGSSDSTASSWDSAVAQDRQSDERSTVRHDSTHPAAHARPPATSHSGGARAPHQQVMVLPVRTRALTSSERGRRFRLREKTHEQSLMKQLTQIREQIAQLESSRDFLSQRSFMTRTSSGGSLEKIARELYAVYRYGLESSTATAETYSQPQRDLNLLVAFKQDFLRGIVERDALCGDIIGVDALLEQWRKHTASYTRFELEIDRVEPIAGSKDNPIVVVHTKFYARFSHETISMMFPGVLECRPDLVAKFIDRDITFDCTSRFTFSEHDQITTYLVSMNMVEALVNAVGSARDVAELMAFSVVTPSMAIQDKHYRDSGPGAGRDSGGRVRKGRAVTKVDTSDQYSAMQNGYWQQGYEDREQKYRIRP